MRVASFSTKKKGGDAHVDAAPAVAAPLDAGDLKTQMAKHVDAAKKELAKLRGATASASMLDHVMVSAYGEVQPLPGLAQVSMKNAQLLTVNPFDASLASAIADAIRDAGLNLNPAVEGNIVRVPVPKASKETRDATIKLVSKIAENAKTRIRHVRQAALDKLKKVEGASSDDTFREMKEVQNITNVATEEIVKLADKKKAELEAA